MLVRNVSLDVKPCGPLYSTQRAQFFVVSMLMEYLLLGEMDQGAALELCPGRSQAPRQRSELKDALHLSADIGQFCVSNEREKRRLLQISLFWVNVLHSQLELFPALPWQILKCFTLG